jgi:hypothetical protein
VTLESLDIRAQGAHGRALYMAGGNLAARDVRFSWSGDRIADHEVSSDAAAYFGGDSVARLERSRIGPGETQALAVSGTASVFVTQSTITNPGGSYAIFAANGSLTLDNVTVSQARMALTIGNRARAELSGVLIQTATTGLYPIYLWGDSTLSIVRSVVCVPSGSPWISIGENATGNGVGIFDSAGRMLVATSDPGALAEAAPGLCAGPF